MADHTPKFAWRAHPARERPGRAALGGGAVVGVGAVVAGVFVIDGFSVFASVAAGVVAMLVLLVALNRFFFPSRFEIDDTGISARYLLSSQRLEWADLRRFLHDENGGYLSTRARRSRLDAWKGMHILFGDERDRVVALIRQRLPARREEAVA